MYLGAAAGCIEKNEKAGFNCDGDPYALVLAFVPNFSPAAAATINNLSKHNLTRDQENQTLDKRPKKVDGDTAYLPNLSCYA